MAGTAKKFWNLSKKNKRETVAAAYTAVAANCSANIDSAKVNAHAVLKGWHYFDQGSQKNREKWGECEMFWQQPVSKKDLTQVLETCVQSEKNYRDEHNMGYEGPRKVISIGSGASSSSGGSGTGGSGSSNTNGFGVGTTTLAGSPASSSEDGGQRRKWLLLVVAAVAGILIIKRR